MRLDEMPSGAPPTRILGLTGDPFLRERIAEMGLTPGQEVRVLRRAPLGGPLEVSVRGFSLAVRRDEAAAVLVVAP